MSYTAPVKDMLFCMKELAGLEAIAGLPGFDDAGLETAQAVLEECAVAVTIPLRTGAESLNVAAAAAIAAQRLSSPAMPKAQRDARAD